MGSILSPEGILFLVLFSVETGKFVNKHARTSRSDFMAEEEKGRLLAVKLPGISAGGTIRHQ